MGFSNDYYRQYIYIDHDKSYEIDYRRKLKSLGLENNLYVRDISILTADDQRKIISEIMIAEKHRNQNYENDIYINILQVAKTSFVIILSVRESYIVKSTERFGHIMSTFKGHRAYAAPEKEQYFESDLTAFDSEKVWGRSEGGIFGGAYRYAVGVKTGNYKVSEKNSRYIGRLMADGPDSVESLLYSVYAKTLCTLLNIPGTVLLNERDDMTLFGGAIEYDNECFLEKSRYNIAEQINTVRTNWVKIERIYGAVFPHERSISSSVYFFYDGIYDNMLKSMNDEHVYAVLPFVKDSTLIDAEFCFRDGALSVQYSLPEELESMFDLDVLHSSFEMLLECAIDNNEVNAEESKAICASAKDAESDETETKAEKAAITWLMQHHVFENIARDEIKAIVDHSSIVYKRAQQNIIEPGTKTSRVYFIGNGKVEALLLSSSGYYNPVRILKSGDVFAIESMAENVENNILYKVNSSEIVVIAVDSKKLEKLACKYPHIWEYLMSIQTKRLMRLQKLWINT